MKLKSLDLTNYRRFKNAYLEFPEGVIGILGLNGVGKSTIIEAIAWTLYGNESRIVRTSKEDLKRHGAAPADECAVKLEFELDGDKYTVYRKMAGKNFQTTAEVQINGKASATSTKSVTALIEQRLGMDYQAFYTSVFAKQKELNALSILDPSKRKKLILRMLNIDSIDKAIISVRTDRRDYETRLSEVRARLIEPDGTLKLETTNREIKEHAAKVQEITENISDMVRHKEKLQGELKKLEQSRAEQRKLREEHNKISTKLTECKTSLDNTSKQQEKIKRDLAELTKYEDELKALEPKMAERQKMKHRKDDLDKLQDDFIRLEELQKQTKKVEEQIKSYNSKLKTARAELKKFDSLETESDKCQKALDEVSKEIDESKKVISESGSNRTQLDIKVKEFECKLKDIQQMGPESECPTCERVLGEHYKVLDEKFTSEIDNLKNQAIAEVKSMKDAKVKLGDAQKRRDALKKREKFIYEQLAARARTREMVETIEREVEQNIARKRELISELEKYKGLKFDPEEYEQVKSDYQTLEKVYERFLSLKERVGTKVKLEQESKKLKTTYKTLGDAHTKLENQLEKLGFDKPRLEQLEIAFDNESKKFNEYLLKLKGKEHELELHNKDLSQLTSKIEELKELKKKAEEYQEHKMYLSKLDKTLDKFKNYMISRIAPTLTQFASELFRELTDGRYNRLEVDNDYNVFIYDNGEAFPLSRFSGGEEDLANLCLRLAISQVISVQAGTTGPNFVILDEIFGSQDLFRKRNLLQALNGLTNKFRQIFLITHIEDVKDYIGYNILVSEAEDGTSAIQVVT
ncbi:AAA family ATPase [[Eubacterium] cellulosolvens]